MTIPITIGTARKRWSGSRRSRFRRESPARIGPDFSPIGSVYWYTIKSTNPAYDLMELKSLQDWVIAKYIRSVPDVVDDSSFGGITREYQVRLDPDKLVSYGLSLAQVEQQLTNANSNAWRKFHRAGIATDQRPCCWA